MLQRLVQLRPARLGRYPRERLAARQPHCQLSVRQAGAQRCRDRLCRARRRGPRADLTQRPRRAQAHLRILVTSRPGQRGDDGRHVALGFRRTRPERRRRRPPLFGLVLHQHARQRRDRVDAYRGRRGHVTHGDVPQRQPGSGARRLRQSRQCLRGLPPDPDVPIVEQPRDRGLRAGLSRPRQGLQGGSSRCGLGGRQGCLQQLGLCLRRAVQGLQLRLQHPAAVPLIRDRGSDPDRRPPQRGQRRLGFGADRRNGVAQSADQRIDGVRVLAVAQGSARRRPDLRILSRQLLDQEAGLLQLGTGQRCGRRQPHLRRLVIRRQLGQRRDRIGIAQLAQRHARLDHHRPTRVLQQRAKRRPHSRAGHARVEAHRASGPNQHRPRDVLQSRLDRGDRGFPADLRQRRHRPGTTIDAAAVCTLLPNNARQQADGDLTQPGQAAPVLLCQRHDRRRNVALGRPPQATQRVQRGLPHAARRVAQRVDQRRLGQLWSIRRQRPRRRGSYTALRVALQRPDKRRSTGFGLDHLAQRRGCRRTHVALRVLAQPLRQGGCGLGVAGRAQPDARRLPRTRIRLIARRRQCGHARLAVVRQGHRGLGSDRSRRIRQRHSQRFNAGAQPTQRTRGVESNSRLGIGQRVT